MTILHAIILGLVEGLTEFLPISSTAHLLLVADWLKLPATEFLKTFSIAIQLGAILAVVIMYARDLWQQKNLIWKIAAAFLPTAILGFLFYDLIKTVFLESLLLIAWALLLGGVAIIIFEVLKKHKHRDELANIDFDAVSYTRALLIGLWQSLAFIPGVSRAGATILGGLSLKINRPTIVAFSFLLAVPTMLAAVGYDLYKSALTFNAQELQLLAVGLVVSLITALAVIKFFIRFAGQHTFIIFGLYRILLGGGLLLWLLY